MPNEQMAWIERLSQEFDQVMGRKVPLWALLLTVLLGLVTTVGFGALVKYQAYGGGELGRIGQAAQAIAYFPHLAYQTIRQLVDPGASLRAQDRSPDQAGLRLSGDFKDTGYLLRSGHDDRIDRPTVELIRLSDGVEVFRWTPSPEAINSWLGAHEGIAPKVDPMTFRTIHPLVTPDGGLVFNKMGGPLFKLDACSSVDWVLDGQFGHSQQLDRHGHIWAMGQMLPPTLDPVLFPGVLDDAIVEVTLDGRILSQQSIIQLLLQNGHSGLVFGMGQYDGDPIHLNEIVPAHSTTPYWQADDLLLSLRNRSAIILYRPSEKRIEWIKTGPWLNQHHAMLVGKSRISLFGNDVMRVAESSKSAFDIGKLHEAGLWGEGSVAMRGHSTIYVLDLATGRTERPFDRILDRLGVLQFTEGRGRLLEDGSAIVEDTHAGRIFRLTSKEVLWSYVNRRAPGEPVSVLSWSRYLPASAIDSIRPRLVCRQ